MSDLEVLTDFLGVVEDVESDLNEYECSLELYRKLKSKVQGWIDQIIYMIDEYEEMEE